MNNDFKLLVEFLGAGGPEVSGRVLELPHGETAQKLDRFASGRITTVERREVCELLQQYPKWLRYVAERVKQSRPIVFEALKKEGIEEERAEE